MYCSLAGNHIWRVHNDYGIFLTYLGSCDYYVCIIPLYCILVYPIRNVFAKCIVCIGC